MIAERSSDGRVKTCFIHDLLRPLCLQICEGKNVPIVLKSGDKPSGAGGRSHFLEHIRSLLGRRWTSPTCVRDTRSLRILHCGYIDSRYTGFEFLVSLKYLVITEVPPLIGSFVNLEYLRVETDEQVSLSAEIMRMKKLRCILVGSVAAYDKDCNTSQINKLEYISQICIREPHDEGMLKCSPRLHKLKLSTREPLDLSFFTQLESLNLKFHTLSMEGISFPSNIKKLTLCCSMIDWKDISIIGELENLKVLKLKWISCTGNIWNTREGDFKELMFLKLDGVVDLTYWNVDSYGHFFNLRRLILSNCYNLEEIPSETGVLEMIEVKGRCQESLVESALGIHEEHCVELGNKTLKVIVTDAYW